MSFRKCMAGIVLAGVFLCGLGTGIAFGEYSTLEYQGNVLVGGEAGSEKQLVWRVAEKKYALPDSKSLVVNIYDMDVQGVVRDTQVPRGEVWFDVSCNENCEPYIYEPHIYIEETDQEDEDSETQCVGVHYTYSESVESGVRLITECRDRILSELRERKFSTYELANENKVTIRVHPSTAKLLNIVNR